MLLCFFHEVTAQSTAAKAGKEKLTYKIIPSEHNTWGYDIYRDDKLFVHQPHVPGMQGNDGFKTKVASETVAKEVIKKIKKGEMPPTISIEEMKKLNVI